MIMPASVFAHPCKLLYTKLMLTRNCTPGNMPPPSVTVPNFVAVGQTVWAYLGGPEKIWWGIPLGCGCGWPLEICFSLTCVTMPNSVVLGQTVQA